MISLDEEKSNFTHVEMKRATSINYKHSSGKWKNQCDFKEISVISQAQSNKYVYYFQF